MATSHAAIVILSLLRLASAQSQVHARMMPSDHPRVYAEESSASTGSSSSSISQDMLRVFAASSTTLQLAKNKADIATANRRRIIQVVEGSVPSPGIGHHN
ncbi:unnamed protein product [Miscanthus lutarioriparius]|uniref:Uncharacterized protein n=1 Tax=Miscanthus lutarioriparius TaxID=422564 RepID=A0A811RYW8_9POAL|nr:unnamed protein product [Miscanthus lutarioriparius]